MNFVIVLIVLVFGNVEAADRNRLQTFPKEMSNFDLTKFMGKWYPYAVEQPCRWKGANQFTDWAHTYKLDSNGQGYISETSWRKDGSCTSTISTGTFTSTASFKARDKLGDLWSGKLVIVCLDYHNYVIAWGCVKELNAGTCDDYWYSVNTRQPKISQKYVDEINQKLSQLWGTSLSEMVQIPHGNPCDKPAPTPRKMFKTY